VWLRSLVPVNQLYMLVILFLYSLVSLDAVLWVVPLVAFYAAYAAMLISTMQMFYSRRKLNDVRALAGMLERFNDQFVQVRRGGEIGAGWVG
jgi:wolfamin